MPLQTDVDNGTFRATMYVDNWVAVFAIPDPPYFEAAPIASLSVIKRDGAEHYDALVALIGEPELQNTSLITSRVRDIPDLARSGVVPRRVFIAHAPLSLFCSDYFVITLDDGTEKTTYDSIKEAAISLGQQLEAAARMTAPNLQSTAQV